MPNADIARWLLKKWQQPQIHSKLNDITAALDQVQREALEAAATMAEAYKERALTQNAGQPVIVTCEHIASDCRALKGEGK